MKVSGKEEKPSMEQNAQLCPWHRPSVTKAFKVLRLHHPPDG
jgi:hypothetical protein